MKRFQKRMLAVLLALLMVVSIIPVTVLSAAAGEATEVAKFSVYLVPTGDVGNRLDLMVNGAVNNNYGMPFELKNYTPEATGKTFEEAIAINYTPDSSVFRVIVLENGTDKTAVLGGDHDYDLSQMPFTMILIPNENDEIELYNSFDPDNPFDCSYPIFYTTKPGDISYATAVKIWKERKAASQNLEVSEIDNPTMDELWAMFKEITKPAKTLKLTRSITLGMYSGFSVAGYYYAQDVYQQSQTLDNGNGTQAPSNAVIGPYAHVILDDDVSINLSGATGLNPMAPSADNPSYMFAWGFVSGPGSVNIGAYANVYEDFQLSDFPDMETAKKMMDRTGGVVTGVFPTSQYYVQNIESALNISYAGNENIHACLALGASPIPIEVPFVGMQGGDPQAMFTINSPGSYITKKFVIDNETGEWKTTFTTHGDASIANLSMDLAGLAKISSEDFQLPISNIDIIVADGTLNVEQDIQLLPCASIQVAEEATLDVKSAIYVVDVAEDGERAYPGVAPIALLCTSEGVNLENVKETDEQVGAQLVVNGTVVIRDTGEDKPAGIAYVGEEAIVSGENGTIVNYSPYEVPAMNVMTTGGLGSTEEVTLEAVRDIDGFIIYNDDPDTPIEDAIAYQYSSDYGVWYIVGDPIYVAFVDNPEYDDNGELIDYTFVEYYDDDEGKDKLFEETEYDFGAEVEAPKAKYLEKENDNQYHNYQFLGWKATIVNAEKGFKDGKIYAVASTLYVAQYEGELQYYDVTFKDEDGTVLLTLTDVPYGSHIEYTGPSLTPPATKEFVGWRNANGNVFDLTTGIVEQDEVLTAYYEAPSFELTWTGNNYHRVIKPVAYGASRYANPVIKEAVAKAADSTYSYSLSGWSYNYTDYFDDDVTYSAIIGADDSVNVYNNMTCSALYTPTRNDGQPIPDCLTDYSLTLNGDIGVNIKVGLPEGYTKASDFEVIYEWGTGENAKSVTSPLKTVVSNNQTYYITTVNVAPKQMNDDITVTLKTKSGIVFDQSVYKVTNYLNDVIDERVTADDLNMSYDKFSALQRLCKSLLYYGSKVQTQFDYTENPVELNPEGYTPIYSTSSIDNLPETGEYDFTAFGLDGYVGSALQLNSKTTYALFFKISGEVPDITATASIDGVSYTTDVYPVGDTLGNENVYLRVDIKDIPASKVSEAITITFDDDLDFTANTGSYIKRAMIYGDNTLKDTVTAFYNYNQCAIAYFTA